MRQALLASGPPRARTPLIWQQVMGDELQTKIKACALARKALMSLPNSVQLQANLHAKKNDLKRGVAAAKATFSAIQMERFQNGGTPQPD